MEPLLLQIHVDAEEFPLGQFINEFKGKNGLERLGGVVAGHDEGSFAIERRGTIQDCFRLGDARDAELIINKRMKGSFKLPFSELIPPFGGKRVVERFERPIGDSLIESEKVFPD